MALIPTLSGCGRVIMIARDSVRDQVSEFQEKYQNCWQLPVSLYYTPRDFACIPAQPQAVGQGLRLLASGPMRVVIAVSDSPKRVFPFIRKTANGGCLGRVW